MRVICCLRSGGEYRPEHVIRLRDQVARFCNLPFVALSDTPVDGVETIPVRYPWPGWWVKMGLFSPEIEGDVLFLDLDSAIVGDLAEMAAIGRPAIMRDVYRPAGLQSSVMFLPERERAAVWHKWIAQPEVWMRQFARGGDQAFLECCNVDWAIWQDALPGQVQSFKAHVRAHGTDERTRVVVFHGKPRPWAVGW